MSRLRHEESRRLLYILDFRFQRIGGMERTLRELALRATNAGWTMAACVPEPADQRVADWLRDTGIEIIAEPSIFRGGAGRAFRTLRLLREQRPEIVNLNFVPALSLVPWAARLAGVGKIIHTDHTSRSEGSQPARGPVLKRVIARILLAPLYRVVSVSRYVLEWNLQTGYCPPDKQICIPNSTPPAPADMAEKAAALRARLGISPQKIMVTQMSWLIPEKGVFDFIQVARLAMAANPNLHFVLAGSGPARPELEALRLRFGLEADLTITGPVFDPIGEGIFGATDVYCHLARWQEAFGWVVTEAMAARRPLVATRVGALPELIVDGATGYLLPVGDAEGIAAKILELAADPSLRTRMGEMGRQRVQREFDLSTNVGRLADLYEFGPPPHRNGSLVPTDCVTGDSVQKNG
jgi:glycosyltransferase involved in cell wall biosynthesis